MGHGFCQWNQGLCMVLVACLVLCLGPGAETLKCKKCSTANKEDCPKKAKDVVCKEGEVCVLDFIDDVPESGSPYVDMDCNHNPNRCGLDKIDGKQRIVVKCCSDRDFCNKDLFPA